MRKYVRLFIVIFGLIVTLSCDSLFGPHPPTPNPCPNDTVDYYDVLYTRTDITCPQADSSMTIMVFIPAGTGRGTDIKLIKINNYNFISDVPILIPRNDDSWDDFHVIYAADGAISDCVTEGTGFAGEIIVFRNTRTGVHYQLTQIVSLTSSGGTNAEFRRNCDGSISPAQLIE